MRRAGLADLSHEIDRARRGSGLLVLAYVDVVGLKAVNDARGHAAGDQLLLGAVRAIRDVLRSYDPVVRVGGDERFARVRTALAGAGGCELAVGFAALRPEDDARTLIARADAELLEKRR